RHVTTQRRLASAARQRAEVAGARAAADDAGVDLQLAPHRPRLRRGRRRRWAVEVRDRTWMCGPFSVRLRTPGNPHELIARDFAPVTVPRRRTFKKVAGQR